MQRDSSNCNNNETQADTDKSIEPNQDNRKERSTRFTYHDKLFQNPGWTDVKELPSTVYISFICIVMLVLSLNRIHVIGKWLCNNISLKT